MSKDDFLENIKDPQIRDAVETFRRMVDGSFGYILVVRSDDEGIHTFSNMNCHACELDSLGESMQQLAGVMHNEKHGVVEDDDGTDDEPHNHTH